MDQAPGLIEVQQERSELVADPQRAVGRHPQRLDIEVGAGQQRSGEFVDDRT